MIIFCAVTEQAKCKAKKHKQPRLDETIFQRIAEDDMDAFEELYRLTERSVYALALSILKNHDDALDVVQDTYLKIRSAAHLYIPMTKPMAWIFTIARNLSMSRLRQQGKADYMHMDKIEDNLSFSYVTNYEDRIVLRSALTILTMQEREIIFLHAISGFKHREIAEYFNLPLSTVLSKYNRGLGKLRKHLIEQEGKCE